MKLTCALFLITFLQVSASSYAQKITLKANDLPLLNFFLQVQKQTGYDFLYNSDDLKAGLPVTLNVKDMPVEEVLAMCFRTQPLGYYIDKKSVLIKRKPVDLDKNHHSVQTVVTGKVTNSENLPFPGVGVRERGAKVSTVSDTKGNFKITVSGPNAILVFSFIGYDNLEAALQGKNNLNVVLKEKTTRLDEVVVIGYGEVNRKDLTGSVGSVEMQGFEKAPVRSFDEALAGRVAGVQVSGNDGQPGVSNNIVIRGGNSLTQDNSPLYVIDGFPIESPDINSIPNQDIESIEILKDASSTAIYGARGANGVILITTKMGKSGAPVVDYDGYTGIQQNNKHIELLSPFEFVRYQNDLNPDRAARLYLTERTLDDYRPIKGLDMQDQLYRTAPINNHNVSIRGGGGGTTYAFSGNFMDQQGVIVNSGFNRIQGRLALTQQIKKNLKFYVNANYSKSTSFGSVVSAPTGGIASVSLIYNALGYRPVAGSNAIDLENEFFDPEIDPAAADYRVNPVISAENELRRQIKNNMALSAYLQYSFNKKLTLKVSGGTTVNKQNDENFHNSKTQQGNPRGFPSSKGINGSLYESTGSDWVNENILTYKERKGKNEITVIGGVTFQGNMRSRSGYQASFLADDYLGIDGIDQSTSITPLRSSGNWTLMSALTRVNYNYQSKYLLTGSFRADGSSKFPSNKWGYFPSVAFAWSMTNEAFMRPLRSVSESKLRFSYGLTGNNRVGDFDYSPELNFEYFSYYSFNNQTPGRGANLTSVGNPNLRWETTSQFNIGYDLGLFKQRLKLTVDAYHKVTDDLLLRAQLPYTTGYLTAVKNIGKVSNRGLEFSFSSRNFVGKKFSWTSDLNIAFNRNKVLALNDNQNELFSTVAFVGDYNSQNLYQAKVGQPLGAIYGAVFDGIYQTDEFDLQQNGQYLLKENIPSNGTARASIRPGDIKLKDISGDGTVTAQDFTVLGNALPKHIGGFSNTLMFKGIDLNILMQWSYGNDVVNGNRIYFEQNPYNYENFNQYATIVDRWSPENPSNSIARAGGVKPRLYNSAIVEDGSFLRLKTVSLGYNFQAKNIKALYLKGLRVYCAAQNLYTWTKYSGSDPEVSVRNSPLTPGFDFSAYPRAFTLTLGLKLSL